MKLTKTVTPTQMREFVDIILKDKIQECEQKQINVMQEDDKEKQTYYQGAIEMMCELNKQVGLAIESLEEKHK